MQKAVRSQGSLQTCIKAQNAFRHLNSFITLRNEAQLQEAYDASAASNGPLRGTLVAVKDNICTTDLPTTCSSKGLENFRSPYDASIVSRIRAANGIIVGKTNMDEFGMGSHSQYSAFGAVKNVAPSYSAGGSSGGSAVAVASGQCHVALGTDTGGSVRLPAAYNGVVGFKPSYGLISRWGVVSYANSLDTVGFLGTNIEDIRTLFKTLNIHDRNDPTSLSEGTRSRLNDILAERDEQRTPTRKLKFGVPGEYNISELSPGVRKTWSKVLHRLHEDGHTIQCISLPSTKQAVSAYYVLAPAEASSNLAKYDGVRYGEAFPKNDDVSDQLFSSTRSLGFGNEVRRRILLGAYSLSAEAIDNYFIQAQRVRRLVQEDFDAAFDLPNILTNASKKAGGMVEHGVDAIICPTFPTETPSLEYVTRQDPLDAYAGDVFTIPASLAGLPALSLPVPYALHSRITGDQSYSAGIQIIGQFGDDRLVLDIGDMLSTD